MGKQWEDRASDRKGHKIFSGQNIPESQRLFPLQLAAVQVHDRTWGMAITALLSTLKSAVSREPALLLWPWCSRWTKLGVEGSRGCTAEERCCCSAVVFPSPLASHLALWRAGAKGLLGCAVPLLPPPHCSGSSAGSSPMEVCQEGGTCIFGLFFWVSGTGGEASSCCDKTSGRARWLQSRAHFQESSDIKRFLEEYRVPSTFWCQTLSEANFSTQ